MGCSGGGPRGWATLLTWVALRMAPGFSQTGSEKGPGLGGGEGVLPGGVRGMFGIRACPRGMCSVLS